MDLKAYLEERRGLVNRALEAYLPQVRGPAFRLNQAMHAFEEGVQLVRVCHKKLDEVEKRVELLLKDDAGRFFTRPFPEDENSGAS